MQLSDAPALLTEIISDNQEWMSLDAMAGTKNVWVKVMKVDEALGRMIFKIKFGKDAVAPRHYHYADAVAVTLSGRWYYDEGEFAEGDVAYERAGSEHTPGSKDGAELFIVFQAQEGDDRLLKNFLPDGTTQDLSLGFFKALTS